MLLRVRTVYNWPPLFLFTLVLCSCEFIAPTVILWATAAGQTSGLIKVSGTGTIFDAAARGPPAGVWLMNV